MIAGSAVEVEDDEVRDEKFQSPSVYSSIALVFLDGKYMIEKNSARIK